jgi:intron-binding protein aquarius
VEAIKAGTQPGLAMVVGPPGTGKTDTAVQIMHVLYHNCPGQRTLLIAHSNQACTGSAFALHRMPCFPLASPQYV